MYFYLENMNNFIFLRYFINNCFLLRFVLLLLVVSHTVIDLIRRIYIRFTVMANLSYIIKHGILFGQKLDRRVLLKNNVKQRKLFVHYAPQSVRVEFVCFGLHTYFVNASLRSKIRTLNAILLVSRGFGRV